MSIYSNPSGMIVSGHPIAESDSCVVLVGGGVVAAFYSVIYVRRYLRGSRKRVATRQFPGQTQRNEYHPNTMTSSHIPSHLIQIFALMCDLMQRTVYQPVWCHYNSLC